MPKQVPNSQPGRPRVARLFWSPRGEGESGVLGGVGQVRWIVRSIDLVHVPQADAVEYLRNNAFDGIFARLDHKGAGTQLLPVDGCADRRFGGSSPGSGRPARASRRRRDWANGGCSISLNGATAILHSARHTPTTLLQDGSRGFARPSNRSARRSV